MTPSQIQATRRRSAITKAAEAFFGGGVAVDERAYRAFELAGGRAAQDNLWHAAAAVLPAISHFYVELGLDTPTPPVTWPQRVRENQNRGFSHKEWLSTFGAVYSNQATHTKRRHGDTDAARRVRTMRHITVESMLLSMLESRRFSPRQTIRTPGRTNLALRRLARDAGVERTELARADVRAFRDRALSAFQNALLVDESLGAQQYILYWDGQLFRVSPFGSTGAYQFDDEPLRDGSLWIARGNGLQPLRRAEEDMLGEFESLINAKATERDFQLFLEHNPQFLLKSRRL